MINQLYEKDYCAWAIENAKLLEQKQFDKLDLDNLVEEVLDMSKRERKALENRLIVLLMHLLKWEYQPLARSNSWSGTIKSQRMKIKKIIKSTPSLNNELKLMVMDADNYKEAVVDASVETNILEQTFSDTLKYSFEQILDDAFYPETKEL